jgi:hypothetical protein
MPLMVSNRILSSVGYRSDLNIREKISRGLFAVLSDVAATFDKTCGQLGEVGSAKAAFALRAKARPQYEIASKVLRALGRNDSTPQNSRKGLTLKKSSLPSAKSLKIKITHPTNDSFGQQCRIVSNRV